MIEQLLLPLETTEAGKYFATFLVSMIPVIELRGGVPFGVALGLPVSGAFLTALLGNMLPVPFIVLFVRRMFAFIRERIPQLGSWVERLEKEHGRKAIGCCSIRPGDCCFLWRFPCLVREHGPVR